MAQEQASHPPSRLAGSLVRYNVPASVISVLTSLTSQPRYIGQQWLRWFINELLPVASALEELFRLPSWWQARSA